MSTKKFFPGELEPSPARLSSGVPGLDTLLNGGFIKGGVYLLLGPPGGGKTVLGNQICFHHAHSGRGNVVYVTLLAESHSRMMGNLRSFDYFEDEMVAQSIHYMSGYRSLEKDGLRGLLLQIAGMVRDQKATLLMIDGITTIGDMGQSDIDFRKFAHELNSFISTSGCTAFLLSSMEGHQSNPEHTMVDGILALHYRTQGLRTLRQIEVRKFRGSDQLKGRHLFKITAHGARVYPRTESLAPAQVPISAPKVRLPFGVPGLDAMLDGGVMAHSFTTLIGPCGTGKTSLALKFLEEGIKAGEKAVFFSFYEMPEELINKAKTLGFQLEKAEKDGRLSLLWFPALEQDLDELAHALISQVERTGAKRVVIDGVDGFKLSATFPKRVNRFLVALSLRIRALGATLVLVEETSFFRRPSSRQVAELSALNENVLYLRNMRYEPRLVRAISVIKMRKGAFDHSVKELRISKNGLEVVSAPRAGREETGKGAALVPGPDPQAPRSRSKGRGP